MQQHWQNWAGNQQAEAVIEHPRGADGIADAVVRARGAGRRVKAIGSGHSFTSIGVPEGVQLELDRHSDLVELNGPRRFVTVQAGMPLRRLNALLEHAGFALTNLGDIDAQTVAGALSTGTHGTGARFGGLATQIRGLELVLADGSLLRCTSEENPDVLHTARVGLGALGVLSTVTLQLEPAFALQAVEQPLPLDHVLDGFDELAEGTDHFEFYWFPHTERTLTKRNTRVPIADGLAPLSRLRAWWDDEFLSNTAFGAAVCTGRRWPTAVRPLNRLAGHALGSRTFTDVSHRVFTSPRRVRFVEMEYAVPRAAVVDVVRAVKAMIERSGWRIPFPIEVRVAAADDIPLSTAYGRASGYVAVHLPAGADYEPYFRGVEAIAGAVEGRPHWGKLHFLDAQTLRGRYPEFDRFTALRDALDPDRVFANAYLSHVLGA